MKRVALKESQPPYTLAIGEEALKQEPIILERDGEPVAAVIPMPEYEAFRAWQEAQKHIEKRCEVSSTFLARLETIRQDLRSSGYRFRTKEDIDAQIEVERRSWGP